MQIGKTRVVVVRGSLLEQDVDAIVNAANTSMRGGMGIDGAIHDAAGPGLLDELERAAPDGADTGVVVVTSGQQLDVRYILHVAGPVYRGGQRGEAAMLARCYRGCCEEADRLRVARLGFCSISTGIYGYPLEAAADVALDTVADYLRATPDTRLRLVIFAMYGWHEHVAFARALARREGLVTSSDDDPEGVEDPDGSEEEEDTLP